MKLIELEKLDELTSDAQKNDRKRKNFNFHDVDDDPVQRMLNAFEPGTYVHPHTHTNPDKREVFIVLRGRLLVLFFNDKGEISRHVILDAEKGVFGVEIAAGDWHTATGLEKGTVVYEIKDGPYIQVEDKNFAKWAPKEGSEEAPLIIERWLKELNL
ncbi:WbuC family cupin fold metalloprotein [Labilibacter marinus]|uniref:WbuC family cupin fold metalloprotein n=1 Tax=Labilibacter marinus TaxID=1477105 RepID=UPI00094FA710|nr:WbuC family cupin fold metalloprotein [Labilibacter marinus]